VDGTAFWIRVRKKNKKEAHPLPQLDRVASPVTQTCHNRAVVGVKFESLFEERVASRSLNKDELRFTEQGCRD
jgi:hypothetical protein